MPTYFNETKTEKILALIKRYPFATIISASEKDIHLSKAPLVARQESGELYLEGHIAKANGHWKSLKEEASATVLFDGPHGYISPSWYPDQENVPTWNYVSVKFRASVRVIEDADWLVGHLEKLVAQQERVWKFKEHESTVKLQLASIVGLEFKITQTEAKFKLSQHRDISERRSVIEALKGEQCNPLSDLAELMQATLDESGGDS